MALANLDWMVGIVPVLIAPSPRCTSASCCASSQRARAISDGLRWWPAPRSRSYSGDSVTAAAAVDHDWVGLEGAASRVVHQDSAPRCSCCSGLLGTVFVRLALNPSVFVYEPRGEMRIVNWYLYTYLVRRSRDGCGGLVPLETDDQLPGMPRPRIFFQRGGQFCCSCS